jgi:hypothetical protein
MIADLMGSIVRACFVFMFSVALPTAALAEPLALTWDSPDGCPDRDDVEELVTQRLGERAVTSNLPLTASGRITQTPNGLLLTLRTPHGERRLEAPSCDELAQSAAVILALLIDPHAAPEPAPESEPEPESDSDTDASDNAPPTAASNQSRTWRGFVRAELVADAGLLPSVALGPGLAGGILLDRTSFELAATYLPTQTIPRANGGDVGELRALSARLGVCQDLLGRPGLGPCLFGEYTRLIGRGKNLASGGEDVDGGLWSLLLAARLSVPFGTAFAWMLELGIGLPLSVAEFTVGRPGNAGETETVHETNAVVGWARTGIELRF